MCSGEFDGAAAASGGGFMPSQATAVPDHSTLSKNRNVWTLLPLTVKELNEILSSAELTATIDGVVVSTITIVGKICDIQDKEPPFTFLIDDGTGQIECSRWQGMYVRVHGHLRSLQDKRTLNAYSMRPVIDFNDISSHFINCIYVHIYNTNLQAGIMVQPQMTNSTVINTALKECQAVPSNQYGRDAGKSIDQIVLSVLRRPDCPMISNGVHRNDYAKQLHLPMYKLMEVSEYLNENSLVYTVDEVHYNSAVNA